MGWVIDQLGWGWRGMSPGWSLLEKIRNGASDEALVSQVGEAVQRHCWTSVNFQCLWQCCVTLRRCNILWTLGDKARQGEGNPWSLLMKWESGTIFSSGHEKGLLILCRCGYCRKHSKLGGKRDKFELRERGDKPLGGFLVLCYVQLTSIKKSFK